MQNNLPTIVLVEKNYTNIRYDREISFWAGNKLNPKEVLSHIYVDNNFHKSEEGVFKLVSSPVARSFQLWGVREETVAVQCSTISVHSQWGFMVSLYVDHCHHKLCISNTKEEKMRFSASDSSLESIETQGAHAFGLSAVCSTSRAALLSFAQQLKEWTES